MRQEGGGKLRVGSAAMPSTVEGACAARGREPRGEFRFSARACATWDTSDRHLGRSREKADWKKMGGGTAGGVLEFEVKDWDSETNTTDVLLFMPLNHSGTEVCFNAVLWNARTRRT
jgi:hypothetical protein